MAYPVPASAAFAQDRTPATQAVFSGAKNSQGAVTAKAKVENRQGRRMHPYRGAFSGPSAATVITRRAERFSQLSPQLVFPDPQNIPQQDVNDWLRAVNAREDGGLSETLRLLFELNIYTGHIANWSSGLEYFSYHLRDRPYCLWAMINHLRSHYSRNYLQPMGKGTPKGALCKICQHHIANPKNPANARLRAVFLEIRGTKYFLHPAQFPYGKGHLMLIQYEHRPMHHDYSSLMDHMYLLDRAPEYAVCQNSHILGGGATIPQHHHVPLMHKADLPIMDAQVKPGTEKSVDGVDYALLDYPFTTFSLSSEDSDKLALAAEAMIDNWKASEGQKGGAEMTRTANYILYKDGERYRIFIFLRDVSCLPGPEFQKIKSEFCGFIELGGKLLLADKVNPEKDRQMKACLRNKRLMARVVDQGLRELDPQQQPGAVTGQMRLNEIGGSKNHSPESNGH